MCGVYTLVIIVAKGIANIAAKNTAAHMRFATLKQLTFRADIPTQWVSATVPATTPRLWNTFAPANAGSCPLSWRLDTEVESHKGSTLQRGREAVLFMP